MASRAQFDRLKTRWRKAYDQFIELHYSLKFTYGETWQAPAAKRNKLDKLRSRESKAADAIFAWLDANSPRSWHSGVPAHWICESLTFEDAITSGPLSVVPSPCYGSQPSDSRLFARAVA